MMSASPFSSKAAKPRLLYVDNDVNSFLAYRLELARAARRAGYDVHVSSPPGDGERILREEGFPFHPLTMSRQGARPWQEWACMWGLVRLYRAVQPELVHHLRLKPVMYGSIAARLAGVPAVVNLLTGLGHLFTVNSTKARVMRNVVEQGCKLGFGHRNHRVIFQNQDDQDLFVSRGIAATQDCRLIRGSGVDTSLFRPQPEVPGTPIVVLPARMLWDKGIGEYVVAAGLLRDKGTAARLVLVGGADRGNPTAIPVEQLQRWNGSGVVEWWGHQTDMQSVFAKSHIVCLPSYREGVPKALIEAAATGRSLVATNVPGCREVVRHGLNGLLVPPHQAAPLAAALECLIRNSAARLRMGRASRALAVSDFSLGRVISETLAVYDEVLPARKALLRYASAV